MKAFFLVVVFLQLVFLANAQNALSGTVPSDRPGATYNATTLQAGVWQVQSGIEWGSLYQTGYGRGYDVFSFPVDLRYGITNRFEIMVSPKFNFASVAGAEAGIGYALSAYSIMGRYSIFDGEALGSFALLGGYTYVSYEGGIANDHTTVLKMLYKIPLGNRFQLASNLGYSMNSVTGTDAITRQIGRFEYTLNISFNMTPKFGIYAESFGSLAKNSFIWFDSGIFWLPNPNLQVDLFYASGTGDDLLDYFTALGISYRFGTPR